MSIASILLVAAALPPSPPADDPPALGYVHDRVILEIERRTPELDAAIAELDAAKLLPVFRRPPHGWRNPAAAAAAGLERFFALHFAAPRDDVATIAAELARLPGVRGCEPCAIGVFASTVPDDPDFPNQWALQPGFLDGPTAWDTVRTSSHIVAVLDNGGDTSHPQLQASLWTNPGEIPGNGIDDEGNGYIDDVHGWNFVDDSADLDATGTHATRVAGVIGATGNDGSQVSGVCWSVPLLFAEVWSPPASPPTPDRCGAGIVYAADQGSAVDQMAWGFYNDEPDVLRAAVDYAIASDVVMVSIAGNIPITDPLYPGAWSDVVAAIATNDLDKRASFSGHGDWCDLSAPGVNIWVIDIPGQPRTFGGTTCASAHTSGCAALLRELVPDFDQEQIRLLLEQSSKDLGAPGFDPDFGWGRIDLAAAVKLATTLRADRTEAVPGDDIVLTIDVPGAADMLHMIAVGRFGRLPGIALSEIDPEDPRVVFVNEDEVLLPLALNLVPGGEALFERFVEYTDGQGRSTATLHMPRGPFFMDTRLDFAAALFDPADLSKVGALTGYASVAVH